VRFMIRNNFILYGLCLSVITALPAAAQVTVDEQTFNSSLGWSETHYGDNTNDADWAVVSSGSNPSCSAQEGAKMAELNSYTADSGAEARLASGALNMTGAEVAECRLWMFHDTGSSGSDDRLYLQVSTDDGSSYFTKSIFHRYDGTSGWHEEVTPLGYYTNQSALKIAVRGHSSNGNNIFIDDIRITKDTLPAGAEGKACSVAGDCNSGICGIDPGGNGRCRDSTSGHDCIDGNRVAVAAGTVGCYGPDVASCQAADSWNVVDCYDDCGPYSDAHECEAGQCVDCESFCDPFFGTGCDADAYCAFAPFPLPHCFYKGGNGDSCDSNGQCQSNNCVGSPSGGKFCEPAGTPCAADNGSPVAAGSSVCLNNNLWTCQAGGGWTSSDCYTNCGFYLDVDSCAAGACATCAATCSGDGDCKPGILCIGSECVGDLPNGSTCTLDTQCASNHCIDDVCCADVCTLPCYRCDIQGSKGTCSAIASGQDPDGECPGEGVCDGACNGNGACDYPQNTVICNTCARCNGTGQCNLWVQAGSDPADECSLCQACGGSGPGCVPVSAGEDPLGDCGQQSAASCGTDGSCDGNGACRLWPLGTECGTGSCANGQAVFPDVCDGTGQCADGGSGSCGFYRCADASRCADSCTTHASCTQPAYCNTAGSCAPDLGEGASCLGVVYPGQIDDAACLGGYCFDDNFDGQGAFCTSDPAACVYDGMTFTSGYALCQGNDWFRVCSGGAQGWGEQNSCLAGLCDAGGGAGSGYRPAGNCSSGPGGGCVSGCQSCEPYMAESDSACRTSCSLADHCWPGYSCQGGECKIPEGIGDDCQTQADCAVGTCTDGVCCNDSCAGPCRSCNLPGHIGFCTMAERDSDPDGDCTALPASTCSTSGDCDGSGACLRWPAGTSCGDSHCEGYLLKGGSTCNGVGNCLQDSDTDCRPGLCLNSSCTQACLTHQDCDASGYCAADGTCKLDLEDGASCEDVVLSGLERDPACRGGFCLDDSWSEAGAYCAADETVCVAAGESYSPGYRLCQDDDWFRICLGGAQGWDPETSCKAADICDAGGGPDSGVLPAEMCSSGILGGCSTACVSCFPYRAEQPGVCAAACIEDVDCWPGYVCAGGVCNPKPGLGDACGDSADCQGFDCADGVCCNSTCEGPCRICNEPSALGVCLFIMKGTDPEEDCDIGQDPCGTTGGCDGLGDCALAQSGVECAQASCTDGVYSAASSCDGKGACIAGASHECASGACQQDRCAPETTDGSDGDASDGGLPDGGDGTDTRPLAEAGADQVVGPGTPVTLDGSHSRDPDGDTLTFVWEQSSGPAQVALSGATTSQPGFTPNTEGVYVFRLVVNDGKQDSAADFTRVSVIGASGGCGCSHANNSSGCYLVFLLALALALCSGRRRR